MMITKREVMFSIVIVALMMVLGFFISDKINDYLMDKYQEVNTALQIDNNKELFDYGVRTNIGNVLAYGKLKAVDGVTFDEIGGNFIYVRKIKEMYLPHTRIVSDGKTSYTQTYYTWDEVDRWEKNCNKITLLDVEFPYSELTFSDMSFNTIIQESSSVRYVYIGCPTSVMGTLHASLIESTVKDGYFNVDKSIEDVINNYESKWQLVLFWCVWVILIVIAVIIFYRIENNWLED